MSQEERIVNPRLQAEDLGLEAGLRPRDLTEFVGQEELRRNLEIALASQTTGQTSDWIGLAAVLLLGLLLVGRTAGSKATFVAVVLGASTLVAIWWPAPKSACKTPALTVVKPIQPTPSP